MNKKYHRIYKNRVFATNLPDNGCEHIYTLDEFNKPTQCSKCGCYFVDLKIK